MSLSKRTTVYLDETLHRALRIKSMETERSMSDLVNEAIRMSLAEDEEDLQAFTLLAAEPVMTYDAVLKELKKHGKI